MPQRRPIVEEDLVYLFPDVGLLLAPKYYTHVLCIWQDEVTQAVNLASKRANWWFSLDKDWLHG